MERDVSRRDIKSMFLAVKPFGGISVANWSMIEPVMVSRSPEWEEYEGAM